MQNLVKFPKKSPKLSQLELCEKMRMVLQPFLYEKYAKKNEILLAEGAICNNIYFVRKGAVKQYYLSDDGKEFIQNFYLEGSLVCHFNSFFAQTPSNAYLEVIEGSELEALSYYNFKKMSEASPRFYHQLAICISRVNSARINTLLVSDAMVRYQQFLQEEPELLQRIPQYMIASYLGMSPETLSRIKKKLLKRQRNVA